MTEPELRLDLDWMEAEEPIDTATLLWQRRDLIREARQFLAFRQRAEAERDRLKTTIKQAREVLPYLYHQIDEIAADHPRVAENLQETYRRLIAALQSKEAP